jgi:hypothetical protein
MGWTMKTKAALEKIVKAKSVGGAPGAREAAASVVIRLDSP